MKQSNSNYFFQHHITKIQAEKYFRIKNIQKYENHIFLEIALSTKYRYPLTTESEVRHTFGIYSLPN